MADLIYTADGRPQGFRIGSYLYAIDGTPVGKVFAEKAYRLDGSYVGAVINNMVVDRPNVSRRSLRTADVPPPAPPPTGAEDRRPVGESFPDCFEALTADSPAL